MLLSLCTTFAEVLLKRSLKRHLPCLCLLSYSKLLLLRCANIRCKACGICVFATQKGLPHQGLDQSSQFCLIPSLELTLMEPCDILPASRESADAIPIAEALSSLAAMKDNAGNKSQCSPQIPVLLRTYADPDQRQSLGLWNCASSCQCTHCLYHCYACLLPRRRAHPCLCKNLDSCQIHQQTIHMWLLNPSKVAFFLGRRRQH